jgi:hypothetical protein
MFDVKGDRPQWQVVYEYLSAMRIGDVLKYSELFGLLPDASENTVRGAFYRAVKQCEDELRRTFANVRTIGYKMVDAPEHERLARGHHLKAKRQLRKSKRKVVSADRSRLTREERVRLDAMELNLAKQIEMTNRLSDKVTRIEEDLKAARRQQSSDSAELSERVDKLAALLAKHGIHEVATT